MGLNTSGAVVIDYKYQSAYLFNEDMAAVKLNDKWGFIDKSGAEVIGFNYDGAELFAEGLAVVSLNEKCLVIDKTGKEIIAPVYDFIGHFRGGIAKCKLDSRYGFIDVNGTEIVKPIYKDVSDFKNGFAKVGFTDSYSNYRCKYIDKTGSFISDKNYDYYLSQDFSDGFAIVQSFHGGNGVIDAAGKEIVEMTYSKITYSAGVFIAEDGDGKVYRFDKAGNPLK